LLEQAGERRPVTGHGIAHQVLEFPQPSLLAHKTGQAGRIVAYVWQNLVAGGGAVKGQIAPGRRSAARRRHTKTMSHPARYEG
jgi:hypothetical protein